MLPKFLAPTWKRYKEDSDAVATWLATTAHSYGYPKDLLNEDPKPVSTTSKLKGRERKLARDKAKKAATEGASATSQTSTKQKRYRISTADFIALADWISGKEPRVKVPSKLAFALNRAIKARKRHNDFYNRQEQARSEADSLRSSNARHGHFIGVLEKVRDLLRPCMTPRDAEATAQATTPSTTSVISLFESLKVEEPSVPAEFGSSHNETDTPAEDEVNVVFEVQLDKEAELEEVYFAVHCLFNDFHNLRQFLKAVWDGYKQGAFDLIAASIATDTAFDFARGYVEEFVTFYPQHIDFEKHINLLYVQICMGAGYGFGEKERVDDEMNFGVYDEAEKVFFPAYMLLSSFCDIVENNPLPVLRTGIFGFYEPLSDRNTMTAREKFGEDKVVLLEALPEFCVLARAADNIVAEDQLTIGIRDMIKTKTVPIWLAFAAQVFLDIHHIFRQEVKKGFEDLNKSAKYIESSINRVMEFHKDLRIPNWPRRNDEGLLRILRTITEWTKVDTISLLRKKMVAKGQPEPPTAGSFFLLKQHLLLCGLLSYSFKTQAHQAGVIFSNAWGSIVYGAQLYNALKQEKMISSSWKDMDLALMLHDSKRIFIGDDPKGFDDYFRRFALAIGISPTVFAKDNARSLSGGKIAAATSGPRGLDELAPISRIFRARYLEKHRRTDMSPEDVQSILEKYADDDIFADDEPDADGFKAPRIKINTPEKQDATNDDDQVKIKTKRRTIEEGIRPLQLLSALLSALTDEGLELTFDHFRLHLSCWRLLRSVHESVKDDLKNIYQAGYLENEYQLPFVVGYIFMTAVQTKKLGNMLATKKTDIVTSKLFVKAGMAVEEWLKTGAGSIECMMLEKWFGWEITTPDLIGLSATV